MLKIFLTLAAAGVLCGEAARYPFTRPGSQDRDQYPRPGYSGSYSGNSRPSDNGPIVFNRPPPKAPIRYPTDPGSSPSSSRNMRVLYAWKQVDFVFPNENLRRQMIQNGQFIPKNTLILDVDIYEGRGGRKVFVTLPRSRPGVPVTLATVSDQKRNGANLLEPYPDWRSHSALQFNDCDNGITSVFRTHVDDCGRLWVLDSGNNDIFAGVTSRIVCPPKILIYDVGNNNQLIGKYVMPPSVYANNTLLVTIAVDTRRRDCSDAFAYIADSISYKMIVFDLRKKEFWRIDNIQFFPYPDQSRFMVNGVSFDLRGGVFGLALGPRFRNKRILYFHSIASVRQSWVDTTLLRNQSMWKDNMGGNVRAFNLFNGTRSSQSAAATMNEYGIMFFGLIGSNEMACWNSETRFTNRNIFRLTKDDVNLQFNSGIKVYQGKLYAATSRLQNFLTNQVKENEENYRVLEGDVQQMTRGTKCEVNPLGDRLDTEYTPDAESVDVPSNEFPTDQSSYSFFSH